MQKALFVSTLLPTRMGGMRSLHYNLELFSKFFDVHFLLVKSGPIEKRGLFDLPKGVKFREIPCLGGLPALSSFLFPLQWKEMARIRSAQEQVQEYVDENGIDVVVFHSMDVTFALRGLRAKVKVGFQIDSFANYYISKWNASHSPVALFLAGIQVPLSKVIELELSRNYDMLAYVSGADAQKSCKGSAKAFVISQGRDPPTSNPNLEARLIDAVIFGRWEHPPNRDGLLRIAPSLGRISGKVKIIGPNLPQDLKLPPNVEALGMVDKIEDYWSNSKISIIPVWYGAGLQTKVFDALRHGSIVVSTPFTTATFKSSGYSSPSLCSSDDLIKTANDVLAGWSPASAKSAYAAYDGFYRITSKQEEEYVKTVARLLQKKAQSSP